MSNLQLRSLTMFAPTNEAFQKYKGNVTQVQYHMCKCSIVFYIYMSLFAYKYLRLEYNNLRNISYFALLFGSALNYTHGYNRF